MSTTSASLEGSGVRAAAAAERLSAMALGNVLMIATVFCAVVAGIVLIGFDGWEYYRAPLSTRGYLPEHQLLRPSGTVGLTLGVAGVASMLMTLPYYIRKRVRALQRIGTLTQWLEVHIFFGIVGPVLITLHTSFKFNGVISVGYWLMMTVWASGFIGRYLYVRIPKTIRGVELSYTQVEARLARLQQELHGAAVPPVVRRELDDFERAVTPSHGRAPGALDLFFGELRVRVRLMLLRRHLRTGGIDMAAITAVIVRAAERATIARRLAHLE
jgi:hypothetical protein